MGKQASDLAALQEAIGITFSDLTLLRSALTHSSYLNENPECDWGDNERLEFLGDAVGGLIAAEHLYERFPEGPEGWLTSLRSTLVRTETLARFAAQIELGRHLLLGRGAEQTGGRSRPTVLSDAFEALLGAIYLDQDLEAARRFFLPLLKSELEHLSAQVPLRDAKTLLQEWTQPRYQEAPSYRLVSETGPDHAKEFTVEVWIQGQVRGRGSGPSKQAAEKAAASVALEAVSALADAQTDDQK
ncbi:MAG: ribonuclease III [Anaerolineales bacterium]|nr:MAG: ribonuclease III [Anaerolineales bacterium]